MKSSARSFCGPSSREAKTAVVIGLITSIAPSQAATQVALSAERPFYVQLKEAGEFGLGFAADGRTVFVGGCAALELSSRSLEPRCKFSSYTRWGHVSADGRLLLATTIHPKTKLAMSYQIDMTSGRVLASKSGLHFAPPIAIDPNGERWAAVRAGREPQASETIEIVGRNWNTIRRGIYGNTRRIFDLKFSVDGNVLLVNGGGREDGAQLSTTDWAPISSPMSTDTLPLRASRDGKTAARLDGRKVVVFDIASRATLASLDIDVSAEEPQLEFSPDGQWFAAKGYRAEASGRTYAIGIARLHAPCESVKTDH